MPKKKSKLSRQDYRRAKQMANLVIYGNRIKTTNQLDSTLITSNDLSNLDCQAGTSYNYGDNFLSNTSSFSDLDILDNSKVSENDAQSCDNQILCDSKVDSGQESSFSENLQVNDMNKNDDFVKQLSEWAVQHKIKQNSLHDLLKLLQPIPQLSYLPLDARTLLKTPKYIQFRNIEPGKYFHFGLYNCLIKLLQNNNISNMNSIDVCINIDGLPLSNSSGSQFYPILCNLFINPKNVEVIGIYHGNEKPKEANLFLQDFVNETINLTNVGFNFNNKLFPFRIKAIICDVPAKSFISYTKGHMGYYSCSKCEQRGKFLNNRICFSETKNLKERTDTEFREKVNEEHHTGTSVLELIPNFNMINDIPLDYMHLICLGVVRKLLYLWCFGKPMTKLCFNDISNISKLLLAQRANIPREFIRKPRSLDDVKRWKATEFRQLLFYTGPLVLRGILPYDNYLNFLCLHVASFIVASPRYHTVHIEYAQTLFEYFVETFIKLYGKEHASHNIHNITHICKDVKNYGTLDQFSAFPFENKLQKLKNLLRSGHNPLSQIVRRIVEEKNCNLTHKQNNISFPNLQKLKNDGYLLPGTGHPQYGEIVFSSFTLNTNYPDNCCMLNDGSIICIQNFASINNKVIIIGQKFMMLENYFTEPCNSGNVGIYKANSISLSPSKIFNIDDICSKYVQLKYVEFQKNMVLLLPLLHSEL